MFTGDIPPVQPVALENLEGFNGMESFSHETGFTLKLALTTAQSTLQTLISIIVLIRFLFGRSSVIYDINACGVYCEKYIVFVDPNLHSRSVFYHNPPALRERQAKQTGRQKKDIVCRSVVRSDGRRGYYA